jgi:hypothetical protein
LGVDVRVALVFRYTFDTAWNKAAQPLDTWFSEYAFRRYGNVANADAAKAWAILSTAVCVLIDAHFSTCAMRLPFASVVADSIFSFQPSAFGHVLSVYCFALVGFNRIEYVQFKGIYSMVFVFVCVFGCARDVVRIALVHYDVPFCATFPHTSLNY